MGVLSGDLGIGEVMMLELVGVLNYYVDLVGVLCCDVGIGASSKSGCLY